MLDNQKARSIASHVVVPIAKFLLNRGISANQVTVFTAMASASIVIFTWGQGKFLLGLLIGAPFVFGDLLDGTMARLQGKSSAYGSFLDSVLDRVTDAAIFGALAYYFASQQDLTGATLATYALASALLISYIRAKADALQIDCKVGIMERTERIAVISLGALLAAFGFAVALTAALWILVALNTLTVAQRITTVRRALNVH